MAWPRAPVAFFGEFKKRPGWALLIGAINLVGIAYGFYYYRAQFAATPWYLWLFVPDSPLAVLWAELALIAFWLKRKPGALDALAFVGNVQVGLWTAYVLLAYAPEFGTLEGTLNTVLLFGHLGMAVLALIFLAGLRERQAVQAGAVALAIALAGGYYLVNDALDYFGPHYEVGPASQPHHTCFDYGLRPYTVPCHPGAEAALAAVTFTLTLGALAALALAVRQRDGSTFNAGRA